MTDARSRLLAAYLEQRQDLVRFFTLRLRSAPEAEDLVQDIYLRIQAAEPRETVGNPGGYLYRLGSNLLLDRLRGERRRAAREGEWRASHQSMMGADPVAEGPGADDAVAARMRLEAIVEVLRELPPQTQRVFRMHKFDGLSHSQVAEALGISRSAVEKHCMTALRRLAERLK